MQLVLSYRSITTEAESQCDGNFHPTFHRRQLAFRAGWLDVSGYAAKLPESVSNNLQAMFKQGCVWGSDPFTPAILVGSMAVVEGGGGGV